MSDDDHGSKLSPKSQKVTFALVSTSESQEPGFLRKTSGTCSRFIHSPNDDQLAIQNVSTEASPGH